MKRSALSLALLAAASILSISFSTSASAQPGPMREPGTGPVVEACQADIAALCEGREHVSAAGQRGGVRMCLEANKAKVSEACRKALDSTGPGSRGRGAGGRGMNPNP